MERGRLKSGRDFYYAEDVDAEIDKLKNKITMLESTVTRLSETNRAGNVANLTPREPIYDEDIQREIASRVASGESKRSLSKVYNVSRGTILNYCNKFVESLTSYEKADLIARFDKGESITELREPLAVGAPKIPDKMIREIIAEKYGTDLFCSHCLAITIHAPREKGGRESCIVCGTIAPETANTDMSTSNNDTFNIDDFEFQFTNTGDSAETSQNGSQSFLGDVGLGKDSNQSESRDEFTRGELDALLGVKNGGQTNELVDGFESAKSKFGISTDPLAE